ncbi:MAG: hypothetical protein HJJLKODD_02094 [Phycisphaerae bacterium]|nr:hypothetical protein [Phycisphaerae bacterium]
MSARSSTHDTITWLVELLDRSYDQASWHGPNLRHALGGVNAVNASRITPASPHTIAELCLHCAYWKYAIRRKVTGANRGSFPLKGSNWFKQPDPLPAADWRSYLQLLETQHQQLREAVRNFDERKLPQHPPGSKVTWFMLISGVASHDVYHAGQIRQMKARLNRRKDHE